MGNHGECGTGSCCEPNHWADTGDKMMDSMVEMADDAWEELMMDKMKKVLEKHRGPQMDKMAEAAIKTSLTYWMSKKKGAAEVQKSYDELKQSFS